MTSTILRRYRADILALAGVTDAGRDAGFVGIVRSRLPWLMINLVTEAVWAPWFEQASGYYGASNLLGTLLGAGASGIILAHAGVKGFSTQKLSAAWQPAAKVGGPDSPEQTPEGIPFNVGIWVGPDGKTVLSTSDAHNGYDNVGLLDIASRKIDWLTTDLKTAGLIA